jgi:hypothetical protein
MIYDDPTDPKNPIMKSTAPSAPRKAAGYYPQGSIEGYMVLPFYGRLITVIGGSFDAFLPGAIGVCLEKRSTRAHMASFALPIEDFTAPPIQATEKLVVDVVESALAKPGTPIYVGCRAGHGRTGTIMAALVKASDLEECDPVAYTRLKYCRSAVETREQEVLIDQLSRSRMRDVDIPLAPKAATAPSPKTLGPTY